MSVGPTEGRQHSTEGIVALVMGIIGLMVLPLIGSVIGLVFGYQSRAIAAREPQRYSDDLGRVGRILSWIGVVLYGGGLVLALLAIGLFVAV